MTGVCTEKCDTHINTFMASMPLASHWHILILGHCPRKATVSQAVHSGSKSAAQVVVYQNWRCALALGNTKKINIRHSLVQEATSLICNYVQYHLCIIYRTVHKKSATRSLRQNKKFSQNASSFRNRGSTHLSSNSISNKYPSLLKTLLDTAIQAWPLEQRTHIQKSLQTVPTYSFALAQLRSSLSRSSLVHVACKCHY